MPYHLATAPHDFYIITYVSNKIKLKINDPTGNRTRVTAVKGPCLNRLTIGPYFFKSSPSRIRTNDPPVNSRMLYRCAIEDYLFNSGSHLLSRAVSSQVSSAACVLTVVFGMGTGVSHKRIATGNPPVLLNTFKTKHELL